MTEYKTTWADMLLREDETFPDPEAPKGDRWELIGGPTFQANFMIWTWRRTVDPQPESEAKNGRH